MLWYKFQALSQVVKYVTRTYSSKPYADIEDASCLRSGCHQTRLIQGREATKKGIVFDHKPHLEKIRRGMQLRCVSCHSQIVVGNHMEVTWDTCYLCHFLGLESGRAAALPGGCRRCHQIPSEPVKIGSVTVNHKDFVNQKTENCQSCHRNLLVGDGAVDQDRCFTCHNQPEKLSRFKDTDFLHLNHVTRHHVACYHCHRETRHGETIATSSASLVNECGKCHTGMHDLEFNLYRGQGRKDIPETPSPMFLAGVDCIGCHVQSQPAGTQAASHALTYAGSEISCSSCHGKEYLGMVPAYQQMVNETLARLNPKLAKVENAMNHNRLEPDLAKTMTAKLNDVQYDLQFVSSTRSVHNIYYIAETLAYDDKILTAAGNKLGLKLEDTSKLPLVSGAYCATLCHNRLGIESPPKMVMAKGREIPHDLHLKLGLACRVCHTFGVHKDIKLNEKACANCHGE
jgi:hypothetical protein